MTYCLFDSKGFVGNLACIHGLYELREFLSPRNAVLCEFFKKGYTVELARFIGELSEIASDDEVINETIQNLKDLLARCRDIAIINNAAETEEDIERKKEIKKRYAIPKGMRLDNTMRQKRALELYQPLSHRVQDYIHAKLVETATAMGAEMTRGNHPFDLIIGNHVIDFVVLPPDDVE